MTLRDELVAWLKRQGDGGLYTEDQNRFRMSLLVPSTELLIAVACVLVVLGGYGAFIAYLALTR